MTLLAGYVAWTMGDGCTMAGNVVSRGDTTSYVRRVDGTVCIVSNDKLRPASYADHAAAVEFFRNIGK